MLSGICLAVCLTAVSIGLIGFKLTKRIGQIAVAGFAISVALFVIAMLTGISWIGFSSSDTVHNTAQEIVTNARNKFGV